MPGSGKTTALVARLGYMICCLGIDPRSILTMTYTVAATADMRARFVSIFGEEYAKDLEFRTINGVCSKIILQYAKKTGAKPFELAEDDGKTAAIISSVFRKVTGEYASESDLKEIRTAVTYAKNMMLDENGIRALDDSVKHFSEIYAGYRKEMRAAGLMDYDDQLTYALHILERYPGILRSIRGRMNICPLGPKENMLQYGAWRRLGPYSTAWRTTPKSVRRTPGSWIAPSKSATSRRRGTRCS